MRLRKNVLALTTTERDNFLRAVLMLKNEILNPGAPASDRLSTYDVYAGFHQAIFQVRTPQSGGGFAMVNGGHGGPAFGPWHRELLIRFELDLQRMVPGVMLPYWDWTDHSGTQSLIFSDAYFGPNGGAGGSGGGTVQSGYFAYNAPSPLPAWWPAGLPGWRISTLLAEGEGTTLRRYLGNDEAGTSPTAFDGLATQTQVGNLMQSSQFENGAAGFRSRIEGANPFHNYVHRWISGHMETGASPNDPLFFLHHCNIDRLWAMWQMDGHGGTAGYPAGSSWPTGHNLNDPMWPWVGSASGYSVFINSTVVAQFPNFSTQPARRPVDLLDHRNLVVEVGGVPTQVGYAYDTEVVAGVSLDRSFSMTGTTPDPMTGAGSISKWDAARQGVTHFLQDCEAAYSAAEAYVVAGVQAFHTAGGGPAYPSVFGTTPPYGLVKAGGSHSSAAFTTAAAAMSPSGGTPLAGALIEAEDDLVRPPHGDRPPDDPRYQYILTDGKRTAGPPLSSLAEPEFPDTTIFAMGFGVGSAWNGVDYATIQDLTDKGRAAPSGVAQVFHGENAGTINKFFTNSIAATIGYTPVVDPVYELFPGEHSMTAFQATSADSCFFISVVGFDYRDSNWAVSLLGPDGTSYKGETASPVAITVRRANGKSSIFLNRGSAPRTTWVGRWYVMVRYKPRASPLGMVMFSPLQVLVPTGAPPLAGPIFSRALLPPKDRPVQRLAVRDPGQMVQPGVGVSRDSGVPSSAAVDVYAKSWLRVDLDVGPGVRFAGDSIDIGLRVGNAQKHQLRDVNVVGRVISPAYSIGNLIADTRTIPLSKRRPLLDKRTGRLDELAFLTRLETLEPGALPIRDRELRFQSAEQPGLFTSTLARTRHPGVYWVSARIDGTWQPDRGPAERFTRVLSQQVALGIKLDPDAARPTLHWLDSNRFIVRFLAADALGNIASASLADPPVLRFRRDPVSAVHRVRHDGRHELEVRLAGSSIRLRRDGLAVRGGHLPCAEGEPRKIDKPLANSLSVQLGGSVLRVEVPAFVGDARDQSLHEAGRAAARAIPVRYRATFADLAAATAEGFLAPRKTAAKRAKKKTAGKKKRQR